MLCFVIYSIIRVPSPNPLFPLCELCDHFLKYLQKHTQFYVEPGVYTDPQVYCPKNEQNNPFLIKFVFIFVNCEIRKNERNIIRSFYTIVT